MPDPRAQAVVDEITAIMRKHDVGGIVVIGTPTHQHYALSLCPKWTCMKEEPEGLRFKLKQADYPNREAAHKCAEDSIGLLLGTADTLRPIVEQLDTMAAHIGSHFGSVSHYTRKE